MLAALAGISCTDAIITSSYGQYPDKCPIQCAGVMANPLNWTRFHRLEDLSRCDDGILFSFNVQNLLTDPDTQVSVQACSYTGETSDRSGSSPPQRRDDPVDQADVEHTLSIKINCSTSIVQRPCSPRVGSAASGTVDISNDVHHAAEMLATYLQNGAECGTTIMFAQSGNAIVGLYSGAQVQKKSAAGLVGTFQEHTSSGNRVLELCNGNNIGAETFGMFAGQIFDLDAIQEAVRTWTNAGCLSDKDLTPLDEVTVGFLVSSVSSDSSAKARSLDLDHSPQQDSNGNCYTYTIQPDDGCWAIGNSFGISESDIEKYN